MELDLPHHLNYAVALSCKTHSRETVDLLPKETPDFIPSDLWHSNSLDLNPVDYKIWVIIQSRVYQTKMRSMDERQMIDVWCDLEQLTIDMLLTTGVEDFERASVRKEDTSITACELATLISSISVTFGVTFV